MVSSSPTFPNAPPPAYSLPDQPPPYSHSDGYPNTPSTPSSSGISSWDEDVEAALIRPPPARRPAAAHVSLQIPALPTYGAKLLGPALSAPRGPQVVLVERTRMRSRCEMRCSCVMLFFIIAMIVVFVVVACKTEAPGR